MQKIPVKKLQSRLLHWYSTGKRDLPWRKTHDPYRIAVSEVMLQQTQVSRVIPKYQAWLKKFPTTRSLAAASLPDVLRLWSGLGYNRRAKNLHAAAKIVVKDFSGRWPTDIATLESLPGFGPYTAGAIAIFSTNQPLAVTDTNVRRVVTRWMAGTKTLSEKKLRSTVVRLVPRKYSAAWHHGLMDLGATICLPKPNCEICPVKDLCRAYPAILNRPRTKLRSIAERFENSNRFVRGQIIKFLVNHHSTALNQTVKKYLSRHHEITAKRFDIALRQLQTEGLVVKQGGRLSLAK